jgi:hypothetical protein
LDPGSTTESNFWDIAVFYTGDWNSIKVSAAAAYTWIETGANNQDDDDLFQVGGSVMHKPSGLGVYAMYQREDPSGTNTTGIGLTQASIDSIDINFPIFVPSPGDIPPVDFIEPLINIGVNFTGGGSPTVSVSNPDTDAYYIKPFIRKAWSPIGATVLYGEWGQYNDQFVAGQNLCSFTQGGGALGSFCATTDPIALVGARFGATPAEIAEIEEFLTVSAIPGDILKGAFVTGSEAERWGLGVVQEIDSAAMHLWVRWQHQELDTDITGVALKDPVSCALGLGLDAEGEINSPNGNCSVSTKRIRQNWDDWDLFQVGGIIFF